MRAVLDHIGIAVQDIEAALAFYRDALGLEVEAPEDVLTQRVRARHHSGRRAETRAARGDGAGFSDREIHREARARVSITSRCASKTFVRRSRTSRRAASVSSTTEPRPGAEDALVAFIHPSAAHGVLVELKQPAAPGPVLEVKRLAFGDLQLTMLHDGGFRLDGGAMFSVVPRPLWEKLAPADDRHRIQLAMRPLLVEADWGRLLVDCGAGDKMAPKQADIYALTRERHLDHALSDAGLTSASIDIALATHLHFDHFGGATVRKQDALVPRFPNARYVIRSAEWEDATHPHERNRASYLQEDFVPLKDAGVVDFFEGDQTIKPGVRVVRTGGHTGQHQIVYVESGGKTAVLRGRHDSRRRPISRIRG